MGFSLFNFRALMQINTRYKRVLYMETLPDPFTSCPASLPEAYRAAARSDGRGAHSGQVKPWGAGPALTAAVVFVSLYALAAVAYAEAVGCEPNLPKTSTLFLCRKFLMHKTYTFNSI